MAGDLATYWRKVARAQDFHVRVVVRDPRDRAVCLGKDIVFRSGGDLLDFRTFADRTLSMIVEMDARRVLSLVESLVALGWDVDADPDPELLARRPTGPLQGTVQLTFPDRAHERAALP